MLYCINKYMQTLAHSFTSIHKWSNALELAFVFVSVLSMSMSMSMLLLLMPAYYNVDDYDDEIINLVSFVALSLSLCHSFSSSHPHSVYAYFTAVNWIDFELIVNYMLHLCCVEYSLCRCENQATKQLNKFPFVCIIVAVYIPAWQHLYARIQSVHTDIVRLKSKFVFTFRIVYASEASFRKRKTVHWKFVISESVCSDRVLSQRNVTVKVIFSSNSILQLFCAIVFAASAGKKAFIFAVCWLLACGFFH